MGDGGGDKQKQKSVKTGLSNFFAKCDSKSIGKFVQRIIVIVAAVSQCHV